MLIRNNQIEDLNFPCTLTKCITKLVGNGLQEVRFECRWPGVDYGIGVTKPAADRRSVPVDARYDGVSVALAVKINSKTVF